MRIPRFVTLLILCVLSASAQHPARAENAAIAGTWMAVHDVSGLVLPHFEVLQLSNTGAADVRVYIRRSDECEKPSHSDATCDNPHEVARGRFAFDAPTGQLQLINLELTQRRLLGWPQHDAGLSRAVLWFGGAQANWRITVQNNLLSASQETEIDGRLLQPSLTSRVPVRVTKTLYRVPDPMPEDFFALFAELGVSQMEALCFVKAYASKPDERFRMFLQDAAVAARRLEALRVVLTRGPDTDVRDGNLVTALRWLASARQGEGVPEAHSKALGLEAKATAAYVRARDVFDLDAPETANVPGLEGEGAALKACRQTLRK